MTLVFNVTNLKYGNYDVLNVLDPLLLSGLDVAKDVVCNVKLPISQSSWRTHENSDA